MDIGFLWCCTAGYVLVIIVNMIGSIHGESIATYRENLGIFLHNQEQTMYSGYSNTIPAAPVQSQANSCTLDLTDQLLGGVKAACMQGPLDRKHCCPVLAAWLMAARSKVALHPPLAQQPGMPMLPDDSLVCIASLRAALTERGITIALPNATCDVVTCFCGIQLSHITIQSCPLPFSASANETVSNSSSLSQLTLPNLMRVRAGKDLPVEPTAINNTSINITSSSSTTPSLESSGLSDLVKRLAANCTDHSYKGCTRCLKTLTKEIKGGLLIGGSNARSGEKARDCEMVGLMWLLEINKTFYIPTVSAVVRALFYNSHDIDPSHLLLHPSLTKCSLDTDNMPLALDYSELLSTSHAPLSPPPYLTFIPHFLLLPHIPLLVSITTLSLLFL